MTIPAYHDEASQSSMNVSQERPTQTRSVVGRTPNEVGASANSVLHELSTVDARPQISGEDKDVSDVVGDCSNSPDLEEAYSSDSDSDVSYYSDDEHVYEGPPAEEVIARALERCRLMNKWLADEKRRVELGEESPEKDGMSDSEGEIQVSATERGSEGEA